MPSGKPISPERRDIMRALWEGNPDMTVKEIAAMGGIHPVSVYRRAEKDGWVRARRPAADGPGGDPGAGPGLAARRALLNGLWLAATRHVGELRAQGDGKDVARGVQELMTMVRAVEKLIEMEDGPTAGGAGTAQTRDEGPEDIDEFRAAITRRLEGLLGKRPAGRSPQVDPPE